MTDTELKKDLKSKMEGNYFNTTLLKYETTVFKRRSFDDLFKYYRIRKVTEKQLLKALLDIKCNAVVCAHIHKVVFYKLYSWNTVEENGLWQHIPYEGTGFSKRKETENTKYTTEYINNLHNQIKQDENKSK